MGMSKFKNLHSLLTLLRGWFDKIKLLLHKSSLINWIDPIRCRRRKIGWLIAMDDIQKTKQISVSGFFYFLCVRETTENNSIRSIDRGQLWQTFLQDKLGRFGSKEDCFLEDKADRSSQARRFFMCLTCAKTCSIVHLNSENILECECD